MKNPFKTGNIRTYTSTVKDSDLARFESGLVHPVYSTFALARDAEWACRLFVLEMKEEDEEGIGTFINIEHLSPAMEGSEVLITAKIESVTGNDIICEFDVQVNGRLIAKGRQGQKILKKAKLKEILGN